MAYKVRVASGIMTTAPILYPVPVPSALVFHSLKTSPAGGISPETTGAENSDPAGWGLPKS
jgi:hypothetical protein